MPYVRGFLEIVEGPGSAPPGEPGVPTHPIAPGGPPPSVWPGPEHPAHPIVLPDPPAGIFPPPTVAHPIVPMPPTVNPPHPPGEVWPPIEGAGSQKFVMLVYVPGYGYKYVVVDPSLKPQPVK